MYVFWVVWAFAVGSVSTLSCQDWNTITTKRTMLIMLGFVFAGIGIPIMSSIAWPPSRDDLWIEKLILGTYCLAAAYAIGFGVTRLLQSGMQKRSKQT